MYIALCGINSRVSAVKSKRNNKLRRCGPSYLVQLVAALVSSHSNFLLQVNLVEMLTLARCDFPAS